MTLYGGMWIVTALLNSHAVYLPEYLVAGGMNWTIEGRLFVTVAWLASSSEHFARETMTSQPDSWPGGVRTDDRLKEEAQ